MTPEEIAFTSDVHELWDALVAAKEADDHDQVQLIEERMRELGGYNTREPVYRPPVQGPVPRSFTSFGGGGGHSM